MVYSSCYTVINHVLFTYFPPNILENGYILLTLYLFSIIFYVTKYRRKLSIMKILIVDDSIFSQKIISNLMKKFMDNLELFFAGDGMEGLKLYKDVMPDYVFLDLLMPKLNGKELIKLIKEYNSSANIFVISADVQKNIKEEIENYNILSFINKPFNEEKAREICRIIKNRE